MKRALLILTTTLLSVLSFSQTNVVAGRNNEVFRKTDLASGANNLDYPWEITYGPDNMLWITEAQGYKVYRMNPNTGAKTTVLDLNTGATGYLTAPADSLNAINMGGWPKWPQGGLAGLALHPRFNDGSGHDFVYISYVHRYLSGTAASKTGMFFRNKLVRFTYNSGTGKLGSPIVICDTLPGSSDHNSQRIIIAADTIGGNKYLFYAQGDMGAGQFENRDRLNKAQNPNSYEGKILRFYLDTVGSGANRWIPSGNPYSSSSAVYAIGIRNNQGLAYDSDLNLLYGSSHGAYSDDEINIIERRRNFGHPLIIGFADGNYNGTITPGGRSSVSGGAAWTDNNGQSACPPIGNELANKTLIDSNGNGYYKDPLFSAYAWPMGDTNTAGTIRYIWRFNPGNATPAPGWPSEAWSGLDIYTKSIIPGWHKSLVAASLKWGRLVRLPLAATGNATFPTNTVSDTVTYFNSQNRFRDLAFNPNGKEIYVVMDNSSTTSGPGSANPVVPGCAGCVQKYVFLGYNTTAAYPLASTMPNSINIGDGLPGQCENANYVVINAANNNNNIWVPITDTSGNIIAEIHARGFNLDTVRTSVYTKTGTVREDGQHRLYANRNITITPSTPLSGLPTDSVRIRLYLSKAEFDSLNTAKNSLGAGSGISGNITNVAIFKNSGNVCVTALSGGGAVTKLVMAPLGAGASRGGNGYVLQSNRVTSFSTFYFANQALATLPVQLLTFTGHLEKNATLLDWKTSSEINTDKFAIERSGDGTNFTEIGTVAANGNSTREIIYNYKDETVTTVSSSIIYYRLRMIDRDGNYTYSNIVPITLSDIAGNVTIFPNPVAGEANVTMTAFAEGKAQWKVLDNAGRTVLQGTSQLKKGRNNVVINVAKLAAGNYYLSVSGAGIDQQVKLQKL